MRYKLLLFTVLWICLSWSQNVETDVSLIHKQFGEKDGFEVFDVSSMVFDDLGWLWISGINLNTNSKFSNSQPIIQRFDGQSFYTLKLPKFKDATDAKIYLNKRPDGQFYLQFKSNHLAKLFLISPEDLIFKEIELPSKISYEDIFLFPYKDFAFVYLRSGVNTTLYKLSHKDLQFVELPNKPFTNSNPNNNSNFTTLIPFDNYFIISDERNGVFSYNADGSLIEEISLESLGLKAENFNEPLRIATWIKNKGATYVLFNHSNHYYQYHPNTHTWTKSSILEEENKNQFLVNYERIYFDELGNFVHQRTNSIDQVNTVYLQDKEFKPYKTIEFPNYINAKTASRDFSKELYLSLDGIFHSYYFTKPKVTTFLKDKSIRGMLPLSNEKVLVGTENAGWFEIDLTTNEEKLMELDFLGKTHKADQNRGIFQDANYFWSNDSNGIIKVDKKTRKVISYFNYPIADMVEDERFIYYGTKIHNLMKFDKIREENMIITSTKDYDVQDILKQGETIYLATTTGLLVYENDALTHYSNSNITDDAYLLAIAHHPKYGLLVGCRSGKIFQFDSSTKTFSLFYEDAISASIASLLFDDHQNVWINTFNGIVKYNPETKEQERFSMSDGLSFYEANRYSAMKTDDGHFLVGTLKGLNYFHPDHISKTLVSAKVNLSSLTYIDANTQKEITITAPKELTNLKTINIPAQSKSIFLKFGLLGMYDADKTGYRYRLNDEPWIELNNTNELKFFSLAAGKYCLQIEAIDLSKSRIGPPIDLFLNVDEFFYKTAWFYLLIGFLVFALCYWYYREQRNKLQLKARFAAQIINSQENERVRIAKDLHDSIGQRLLILKNMLLGDPDTNNVTLVDETIKEVRNMSHQLHPFQFEKLGLVKSLENLMDAFQKTSSVFYSYEIDKISGLLPKEKELFLFRMLQECVSNVEKHAQATACNLKVSKRKNSIHFKLKDNGVGFSTESQQQSNASLGMQSLKERALYINAQLEIKSAVGSGTTVIIKIDI